MKRMTPSPGPVLPPSVRLFAEFIVIILGVLIALAADTWRESRQEVADAERHLYALRDDMAESVTTLRSWRATRDSMEYSLVQLLEMDLSAAPPDAVSARLYQGLFMIGNYEPRLASMRDLEATGEVRLLSPEIRLGLAELGQRLGDFQKLEDDLIESQQGLIDPFLAREFPLAAVLREADALPISARSTTTRDWEPLTSDHARSLMAFKLSLMKIGTERGSALEEQMLELLGLIEDRVSELDR